MQKITKKHLQKLRAENKVLGVFAGGNMHKDIFVKGVMATTKNLTKKRLIEHHTFDLSRLDLNKYDTCYQFESGDMVFYLVHTDAPDHNANILYIER